MGIDISVPGVSVLPELRAGSAGPSAGRGQLLRLQEVPPHPERPGLRREDREPTVRSGLIWTRTGLLWSWTSMIWIRTGLIWSRTGMIWSYGPPGLCTLVDSVCGLSALVDCVSVVCLLWLTLSMVCLLWADYVSVCTLVDCVCAAWS